jgi:SAM-dependent methyltransferase
VATTPRERDVDSFDRRARSYEHDWRSPFHTRVVAGSVEVLEAGAERLPFANASFDLAVSTFSFAHWADQPAGLAEIARVLRPAVVAACS